MMDSHFFSFLLLCLAATSLAKDISLVTSLGNITGTDWEVFGTDVYRFKGIPYAKSPTGDRRFAKPEPYGKFANGSLNARKYGAMCGQFQGDMMIGSEDCLFLNIFVPANATDKTVMIWIHGGSWITGSSNTYPSEILVAMQDVIVVTINYRLNAFGFLSSKSSELVGNYGMWDQKLAIEWTKDNIADYGGDPNKITLFGESAGAFCISYHMISPLNNITLFQRAITESGSAFSRSFVEFNPLPTMHSVAETVECNVTEELVKCLRSVSYDKLLKSTKVNSTLLGFRPIPDDDYIPYSFASNLAKFTKDSYSHNMDVDMADFSKYDVFSGWNDQEGLLYIPSLVNMNEAMTGKDLSEGITEQVLFTAVRNSFEADGLSEGMKDLIIDLLINYYMNNPYPMTSDNRSANDRRLEVFVDMAGRTQLMLPTIVHLQLHSLLATNQTFAYHFHHKRTAVPALWYEGPDWLRTGSDHADELYFVFGYALINDTSLCQELLNRPFCGNYTSQEIDLSTQMMSHWANFAKYGNPGSDYVPFSYKSDQTYTVLQTGSLERKTYPLNDYQRLQSAVDAAIIQLEPVVSPTTNVTAMCMDVKFEYLQGMITLTQEDASKVMMTLLVITILLGIVVILLILNLICNKVKAVRSKKDEKHELISK